MIDETQREIAESFSREIDNYLEYFKKIDIEKRESLINRENYYLILSAVLPIVITFVSAYAYIVTKEVVTFLASLVDVVPPILQKTTKNKINFYNECIKLRFTFIGLKEKVNRLAIIGQLKGEILEGIRNEINRLTDILARTLRVT